MADGYRKTRLWSWRRRKAALVKTLSAALVTTLVLSGCDDNTKVVALEKRIEDRDAEIKTLKDDLVERSNRIGFLEGQIEARLGNFDTALKDGLAACRVEQNDAALREQLTRIEASCVKLSKDVQVAVDCSAEPRPAGCTELRERSDTPVPPPPPPPTPPPPPPPTPDCAQIPTLPGCRPLRPDDPPPQGSNVESKDEMRQTVLLAGAYIACTYYTAGACAIAVSLVAGELGMGESDVRNQMETSFKDLGEAANRGVEIPGPDGKPVVLTLRTASELMKAKEAYSALPQSDRDNPCKVIEIFRSVGAVDQYLTGLLNPLQFNSEQQKETAIAAAREVDLKLAEILGRVPVKPEAFSCAG